MTTRLPAPCSASTCFATAAKTLPSCSARSAAKLRPWRAPISTTPGPSGTEKGVTEPKATFSACFGALFLPLPPGTYARMLGEKLARHGARVWLVNTGWTGGPYGVGKRIQLGYTRRMVTAIANP